MFKTLFPCALAALIATVSAGEGWLTNIETGIEQAKKENKVVFVEFTGSDWCGPCMMLKKEVLDSPEFKEFADKELVLVELDRPRKKEMSDEQKAYVDKKAKEFAIRGVPSVFLLDANGKSFFAKVGGSNDKAGYIQSLKDGIANRTKIDEALSKAEKAEGLEKAKLLDSALKLMDPSMAESIHKDKIDTIIAIDKEDTLGYKAKEEQKQLKVKQQQDLMAVYQKISPLMQEKKWAEIEAIVNEKLKEKDLVPDTKLALTMGVLLSSKISQEAYDDAIAIIKSCQEILPKDHPLYNHIQNQIKTIDADKDAFIETLKKQNESMKKAIPAAKVVAPKAAESKKDDSKPADAK